MLLMLKEPLKEKQRLFKMSFLSEKGVKDAAVTMQNQTAISKKLLWE